MDQDSRPVKPGTTWLKKCYDKLKGAFYSLTIADLALGLLCVFYAWAFWRSVHPYWFHPEWTTDDALQQIYPFHKVLRPALFKDDIITKMMECYLTPLHYWLCYFITWLSGNPIMMGHWVMLIQVLLTLGFVFMAVKQLVGVAPAFFAVTWMLHTRHIMQRLTAGLPRGWAAPILGAYLYFILKGSHWGVLAIILIGCLLHPPATLVVAASYGLFLLWRVACPKSRRQYLKPLLTYLILSPVFVLIAWSVVRMPPEIGTMASYEKALKMPEFSYPKGRFPFVPLRDPLQEIRVFGFQAFVGRLYNPARFWNRLEKLEVFGLRPLTGRLQGVARYWRHRMSNVVMLILTLILLLGFLRRRQVLPAELVLFLVGALSVYFAARVFAFKLYVPDRHLQFPFAFFFVVGMTIAVWRAFYLGPGPGEKGETCTGLKFAWPAMLALGALGLLIYSGSGAGLYGTANFNYSSTKHGDIFKWIKSHTPENALIAGDPTLIDGVQLFAERRAFVTTETSHPFYDRYYAEIKRRLEIVLRAHYARDFNGFLSLLEPEGIDYFVFAREKFKPGNLEKVGYYTPFDTLVKELASYPRTKYAYAQLPKKVDLRNFPAMPYRDNIAVVVDLRKLREFVEQNGIDERLHGGS